MKKKKIFLLVLIACLLFNGLNVYAGKIISQYKTSRGTIATVEAEEVHKNRIGLTVNGRVIKQDTWYANDSSYVPLRAVAENLNATVAYDSKTQSANIKTDAAPDNIKGIYKGWYVANQGKTGLKLTIEGQKAYFEFYPLAENPHVGSGKFEMNVEYDKVTGRISLKAGKWINNPSGYATVDLIGGVNQEYINGALTGGDYQFSIKRIK